MNAQLEQYLKTKFPKLYAEGSENDTFTHCGFECDDGWFRIILWLSRYLQDYIDIQNDYANANPDMYQPVKQIKVLQVKEKFGTLRYFVEGGNEHTRSIISFAEYISGYTCEASGKTDEVVVNSDGWIKTMHIELAKNSKRLTFVDDEELRNILNSLKKE